MIKIIFDSNGTLIPIKKKLIADGKITWRNSQPYNRNIDEQTSITRIFMLKLNR